MKTYRLILTGLGNVGRNFLRILHTQADVLRDRYGVALVIVAVADSSGGAMNPDGLDVLAMHEIKANRKPISSMPRYGKVGVTGFELAQTVDADFLLEATPVSLKDGQPGLDIVRTGLRRGLHCVLANKGPLALAYQELDALSKLPPRPALRFSGCVGGALPTVNVGQRDMAGARITKIEAMVNGTCQGILRLMEDGHAFEDALSEMQRRGVVEPDPSLDIDGWDEAVKLVIIANAVLNRPTTLSDLSVRGIRDVTVTQLHAAAANHERIVLLGTAEPAHGDWIFKVAPVALPMSHPLARMGGDEMGVVYHTDIAGKICVTSAEVEATPTAAAMLRDVLTIIGDNARYTSGQQHA